MKTTNNAAALTITNIRTADRAVRSYVAAKLPGRNGVVRLSRNGYAVIRIFARGTVIATARFTRMSELDAATDRAITDAATHVLSPGQR